MYYDPAIRERRDDLIHISWVTFDMYHNCKNVRRQLLIANDESKPNIITSIEPNIRGE
jgi:hypothetical protein